MSSNLSSTTPGCTDRLDYYADGYRHQRLYVALLILLALFLRLYRLSSQSIWVDEMLTLFWSGFSAPFIPADVFTNLHSPLHSLVMFLWTRLAGESEFALRFPSVVFSVLSLFAIYRLILRLSGPRTAAVALAVMALSPFHVWYAQEARNYSMLLFFSALSFESFLNLLSEPDRKSFGKYVLFTFAAFLSNMSAVFVVAVQDVFFLISRRKLSFRSLVFAHVILAFLLLPWLGEMLHRVEFLRLARTAPYVGTEFLRGQTTFTPFAVPYTFFVFSLGYSFGPSLAELHESARLASFAHYGPVLIPAAIAFSLAVLLGIISLRNRTKLLSLLLVWIALPLVVVSFFAIKNFKPFNPRYLMVSYPAFVLLLAEGLRLGGARAVGPGASEPEGTVRRRGMVSFLGTAMRLALCALVLGTMLLSLWNYYRVPRYGKDDFRAASRTLEAEFAPGDMVFTEGTYEPLLYYLRHGHSGQGGAPITFLPLYPEMVGNDARVRDYVLEKAREANRVWLVTSRLWNLDPERKVPALFQQMFLAEREFHFQGVDVVLYSKR
ncbi:MAG: glycosyltransferase family 39 protein [Candidatus Eisenbacteria bacterium]|nr:glycosyltransferase family 39 protein [Candidatus Eisenbacteria bacterium]